MSFGDGALLVLAACGAGALNAIAGGGSFLSFPALVLTGVPAVAANATSTVALWPASLASTLAYRDELRASRDHLVWLSAVSLGGGIFGALLLLLTPTRVFEGVVPFLLLGATLVFTFGDALRARLPPAASSRAAIMPMWALVSVYGGYFGGGMGLLMLALLTVAGLGDLHRMNALKSGLGVLVNGVAVAVFAVAGAVQWAQAGLMIGGSILGGYFGARIARRVDARRVRPLVVFLGWSLTVAFFWRWLRGGP